MDSEYRDKFKFETHIETEGMSVSASCRVTVEKFWHDTILVEFASEECNQAPMVFVGIEDDGVPYVDLNCGVEETQFRLILTDGKWSLKTDSRKVEP